MDPYSKEGLLQRATEWNKETKRLIDLDIYGGGGIEPIHPECAYPREEFVGDNEIYLLIDKTTATTPIIINRIAVAGGNGVGIEFGYIGTSGSFINQNLEWGYSSRIIPYVYNADTSRHGEVITTYVPDEIVTATHFSFDHKLVRDNCPYEYFWMKLTPLAVAKESSHGSYFHQIIINHNYTFGDGTVFVINTSMVNIRMIVGRFSKLYKFHGNNINHLMYVIFYGEMIYDGFDAEDWYKLPAINFSNTPMLEYTLIDQIIDKRYYNSALETEHKPSIETYGFFQNSLCKRAPFIDFYHSYKIHYYFYGVSGLNSNNIPLVNNEMVFASLINESGTLEENNLAYMFKYYTGSDLSDISLRFTMPRSIILTQYARNSKFTKLPNIIIEDTSKLTDVLCDDMMSSCLQVTLDTNHTLFSFATYTSFMFQNVVFAKINGTRINLPNVTYARYMFYSAENISSLEIIADKCISMSNMFRSAKFVPYKECRLTIPNIATDISNLFYNAQIDTIYVNLKGIPQYMENMFDHVQSPDIDMPTMSVYIKFNRDLIYNNIPRILSFFGSDYEPTIGIFNLASFGDSDFYTAIDYGTISGFYELILGGYVDRNVLPIIGVKYQDLYASMYDGTQIVLAQGTTIKRGVYIFDIAGVPTLPTGTYMSLGIWLNPLRWDDTKEYLQPEEYKTLFNWGTTDYEFKSIIIHLNEDPDYPDQTQWPESYWSGTGSTDTETTLFGFPTSGTKKPSVNRDINNGDVATTNPFPESWLE